MAHRSLSICTVLPVSLHFAYTKYGSQATNTSGPAEEILVLIPLASCDGSYEPNIRAAPPEPSLLALTKYGTK